MSSLNHIAYPKPNQLILNNITIDNYIHFDRFLSKEKLINISNGCNHFIMLKIVCCINFRTADPLIIITDSNRTQTFPNISVLLTIWNRLNRNIKDVMTKDHSLISFPYRPLFNPFLIITSLEYAMNINSGRMNDIRIKCSCRYQLLNLSNSNFPCHSH